MILLTMIYSAHSSREYSYKYQTSSSHCIVRRLGLSDVSVYVRVLRII